MINKKIHQPNIKINKEINTQMKSLTEKLKFFYQKIKSQITSWLLKPDMTLSEYYRIEARKNPSKQIRNPWEQI
jgi:hypothetical protein